MIFTKERKKIIEEILNSDIKDIDSFVNRYYHDEKMKIKSSDIESMKLKDFKKIEDIYEEYADSFLDKSWRTSNFESQGIGSIEIKYEEGVYSGKDVEELKDNIRDYSAVVEDFDISTNNSNKYNILDKEFYAIDDFTHLEDFYFVWDYLKNTNHIKLEKSNTVDPLKYFLKKEDNKAKNHQSVNIGNQVENPVAKVLNPVNPMNYRFGYKDNDMEYLDYKITFDYNQFSRFAALFHNKIIVMPSLSWLVERKYKGIEEYTYKKSTLTRAY